jgi:hypothetical protein
MAIQKYTQMKLFLFLLFVLYVSAYREERIISAQYVTRKSTSKMLTCAGIDHHGIKVVTDIGNTYLIHNVPSTGTVVTDTRMSSEWKIRENIPVRGYKTIGNALKAGSGKTNIGVVNYLTGGTCIGSAINIKKYLISD